MKLFNWNILISELKKIDIQVDSDTKALIIAGDLPFTNELMVELYSYEIHLGDEPN